MVSVHVLWHRKHNSEPTCRGKMIERNPSFQKKWKPHWFYALGAWEFAEGDESTLPRIARRFRILGVIDIRIGAGGTLSNQVERSQPGAFLAYYRESGELMRPSRSDVAMQAQLMKLAKKGQSNGLASGSQTGRAGALSQPQCWF
ncbi:unnamed protein product [Prunus armeniaca]